MERLWVSIHQLACKLNKMILNVGLHCFENDTKFVYLILFKLFQNIHLKMIVRNSKNIHLGQQSDIY
jgi:hypothetical protein